MRFFTAINILKLPSQELDDMTHHVVCPWCGENAWIISDYMQCYSGVCPVQAASTYDLMAKQAGGYKEAARFFADHYNLDAPEYAVARKREDQRLVLDTWISFCQQPPASEALKLINRFASRGWGIKQSRFNAAVLDSNQMKLLVEVAKKTGASYPETWNENPPGAGRVFCVQSQPHTIDRLLVMNFRGRVHEIVWNRYSAGFVSLLGMRPDTTKFLAGSIEMAQRLQHDLALVGHREEVVSVYADLYRGDPCPRWELGKPAFTAVLRYCTPHRNSMLSGPEDLVVTQQVLDQFPGLEELTYGMGVDAVMDLTPKKSAWSFSLTRFALIAEMVPPGVTQIPAQCASIIEQTGTRSIDIARLLKRYDEQKRYRLMEDVSRISLTRVIARDLKMKIKETANDYQMVRGAETVPIANFSLRISSSVSFPNQHDSRFCQATLRCGTAVTDVLFPQNILNEKVQSLETELQRQLSIAKMDRKGNPTVIEVGKFRNYVVPYLRTQAAKADTIQGVDLLGWSRDRQSYTAPGFILTAEGARATSPLLCPSVPVLTLFRALSLKGWAGSCPQELDESCRDLVAMVVASCVRYYRRCVTKPIMVGPGSGTITILNKFAEILGQKEIFQLNQNIRKGSQIEGVHGYPFVAEGPRQASENEYQTPYIHICDRGYQVETSPTTSEAALGGRALQYCLRAIVEWCLKTGGDEFVEVRSTAHHRSLLREGRWLIEKATRAEEWKVSHDQDTALETLLAQIPYEEAGRRMTLVDGQELTIDIRGLEHDHDGILREARDMGTMAAIAENHLISPAVRMLPAIKTYYGQSPDLTVVAN